MVYPGYTALVLRPQAESPMGESHKHGHKVHCSLIPVPLACSKFISAKEVKVARGMTLATEAPVYINVCKINPSFSLAY